MAHRNLTAAGLMVLGLVAASYPALGQPAAMTVLKVKDGKIAADRGAADGVEKDLTYSIRRDGASVCRASVTVVRDRVCALKILALEPGFEPAAGDRLVFDPGEAADSVDLLGEFEEAGPAGITADSSGGFYASGRAAARRGDDGGGAFVGGLTAGTLLGVIGWGFGALAVNRQDSPVPSALTDSLTPEQKTRFKAGYEAELKSLRRRNFHRGAFVGVLSAAALLVFVDQSK